jgi:hypothetical protein
MRLKQQGPKSIFHLIPGGDLMRQQREAIPSTKAAAQARRRRLTRRMSLLASALGLLVFFSVAQAASAKPALETVTPNSGCPGDIVIFKGTTFLSGLKAEWENPQTTFGSTFGEITTEVKVLTSTTAEAAVPFFFQVVNGLTGPKDGVGQVHLKGEATFALNNIPGPKSFTYTNLYTCFGKAAQGPPGPTGPTGPTGPRGATGVTGPAGSGAVLSTTGTFTPGHIVQGTGIVGTAVTLSFGAGFSTASSYTCYDSDLTVNTAVITFNYISGTEFNTAVANDGGATGDSVRFVCIGT